MRAPRLRRRLGAFIYEGVLLFGVVMAAGLIYALLTNQRHALQGSTGLRIYLFVVLGLYFVWFWTRQGQTLAMRTWRIELVTASGKRVGRWRASCRYLLAWLWFLPALLSLWLWGIKGGGAAFGAVTAGVLAYAALAWLNPQRQFLHDIVCGTRLVTWVPQQKP
jgi:uncharacterized RDD family membrane protein YckC